jgi:hypothetical protein
LTDLFAWAAEKARGTCADCPRMDPKPVGYGAVRYCRELCIWTRPDWSRRCADKEQIQ